MSAAAPRRDATVARSRDPVSAPLPTTAPQAIADFLRDVRVGVEDGPDPLRRPSAPLPLCRPPCGRRSRRSSPACAADTTRMSGASTRPRRGGVPVLRPPLRVLVAAGDRGVRNVPAHGRALIVANHAGSLFPFDATMMTMALMKEHPLPRWPRFMVRPGRTRASVPFEPSCAASGRSRRAPREHRPARARRARHRLRPAGLRAARRSGAGADRSPARLSACRSGGSSFWCRSTT